MGAQYVNIPGKFVKKETTVNDFEKIVTGQCDAMPEQAFYMKGTLEDVLEDVAINVR